MRHLTRSTASLYRRDSAPEQITAGKSLNAYFASFVTFIILRLFISDNVLNLIMDYSTEQGGNIFFKIHPGSWGLFVLAAIAFPRMHAVSARRDRRILNSLFAMEAIIVVFCVVLLVVGRTTSVGFLIDSMMASICAGCIMVCLPLWQRRIVGRTVLTILVANSVIALAEFIVQMRLLPYPYTEPTFRATALLNHPLLIGLYNATAVSFIYLVKWSAPRKFVSVVLLIGGTLAAGARTGTIMTALMALVAFLAVGGPRTDASRRIQLKAIVVFIILLLAPLALLFAQAVGLTERFEAYGLFDESALARIRIYEVFDYLQWDQIIWGVNYETWTLYTTRALKLDYVESSLVVFVLTFGAIGAFILVGSILNVFWALSRGTELALKLGLASFLIVASSNNALSSKSPVLMLVFLLALAFGEPVERKSHQSSQAASC